MFRGRYEHSLDEKGRLQLPSSFRHVLKEAGHEDIVITRHLSSPCLVLYPLDEWKQFEQKLASLPQFDPNIIAVRRLYVGSAVDCSIDKQGRVLVPQTLREALGFELQTPMYLIGSIKTIELWSAERWNAVVEPMRQSLASDVLLKLSELGL